MDRVLVIEDEAVNQLILKQALSQQGYDVAVASDGKTGLAMARSFDPMLIICDWMMPLMSGLEVCQIVKADQALSSIFFILLTARSGLRDRVDGLDAGADDFLNKPLQPPELLARVRSGLRIYQSAQSLRLLTAKLQAQQQKLTAELAQAASYVSSLLPKPLTGTVNVTAQFHPSAQLGGDCFDFYWLDEDHLVLYLLDVSGHGLGAALPSVSVQQVMRSQSLPNTDFLNPASVLSGLNKTFQMSAQNPRFFTLWYGIYCHSTRQLTYASAGHPPALLLPPKGAMQSVGQVGQFPIGTFERYDYTNSDCAIAPGSVLYLFSDGFYDIEGNFGGYEQLSQLIETRHSTKSTSPALTDLIQTIQSAHSSTAFDDDRSIIQACF